MSRSGSAYTAPDVISYSYNDRGELTGAVSNVDATYSYSYAYDPIGNRVSSSDAGVSRGYTTNSLNQYTSVTEGETELFFSYDLDGSMTYRPVEASSGWTQVWNCENRLVETSKGNTRLTFRYDYLGRRVEKCIYLDNTLTEKTFFVYDGFKCVEELDALNGNAILARHLWQPPEAGLDVLLATYDPSGISFFLHDANKNVAQSTDASGTLRESYSYAPFGESLGTEQARIGFSSEVFDGQTSLVYYNYRYLSLCDGRWARRDPLGEAGGIGLYNFCHNDSIDFWDKLGREVPALDSVSANPSISLDLYYDTLEQTFRISRAQIMRQVKRCESIYVAYKSLKCSGCKNCIFRRNFPKNTACLALEVSGRSRYLSMKCDYYLPGSIMRGTARSLRGHIEELLVKSKALATCIAKTQE